MAGPYFHDPSQAYDSDYATFPPMAMAFLMDMGRAYSNEDDAA